MSKTTSHAVTDPLQTPLPPTWQGREVPALPGSLGTAIGAGLSSLEALLAEVRGVL